MRLLLVVTVLFRDEFLPGRGTATGFAVAVAVMTGIMAGFHVLQDRRRPTDQVPHRAEGQGFRGLP